MDDDTMALLLLAILRDGKARTAEEIAAAVARMTNATAPTVFTLRPGRALEAERNGVELRSDLLAGGADEHRALL